MILLTVENCAQTEKLCPTGWCGEKRMLGAQQRAPWRTTPKHPQHLVTYTWPTHLHSLLSSGRRASGTEEAKRTEVRKSTGGCTAKGLQRGGRAERIQKRCLRHLRTYSEVNALQSQHRGVIARERANVIHSGREEMTHNRKGCGPSATPKDPRGQVINKPQGWGKFASVSLRLAACHEREKQLTIENHVHTHSSRANIYLHRRPTARAKAVPLPSSHPL